VSAVCTILGPRLVGVYLDGSIALGEFEADRSDIDFVVVTAEEVRETTLAALQALHARLAATAPRWGLELEGSYVTREAIRAHDPRPAAHPYIDRHTGRLEIVHQESGYWVIHRHVLREHGVALAGPEARTLIDPVTPAQLRDAAAGTLREWWRPMLDDPVRLQHWGYRAYAVLTMCRMLYTLSHGAIVSKRLAARWVQETLDSRWTGVIDDALVWSSDRPPVLADTLALIRYTSEQLP
jgi:predicted nucleotidyltransferase